MKMNRMLWILVGTLILTVGAEAQAANYDDIKAVFAGVATAVDTLAQDVDQAKGANDVANAFVKFGQAMRAFKSSMEDLQKKYPELADDQAEPPADVKDSLTAMQASFGKMKAIMKKADPYITDPAVQDAIHQMKGTM